MGKYLDLRILYFWKWPTSKWDRVQHALLKASIEWSWNSTCYSIEQRERDHVILIEK